MFFYQAPEFPWANRYGPERNANASAPNAPATNRSSARYFLCRVCAFVWMDPAQRLSRQEEYGHYQLHQNDPGDARYRYFLNRLWAPLREKLPPGARGLDYGSGPGPTLHLMACGDGFSCDHYDPFFHPRPSLLEQRYDFITCSETAEHFYHPAEEFRILSSLLDPGGWLGVMTARRVPGTDFASWHYRRDPAHVAFYTETTFAEIASLHGFQAPLFPAPTVTLLRKSHQAAEN